MELSSTLTADIPAIGTTYEIGSLLATSGSIGTMDIYVNTSRVLVNTTNLFAETKAVHYEIILCNVLKGPRGFNCCCWCSFR